MTNSIKSVIVIGATGLVGKSLIKQLNDHPFCEQITALVRKEDQVLKKYAKVRQFIIHDFFLLTQDDVQGYSQAFSCLGTTLKKAGSKENFYRIDFEMNAHFADLIAKTDAHYILVSAMGADASSRIFYNQVKGRLEQHIQQLGLQRISIIRPSLLLGEREESRTLEGMTQKLYLKFSNIVPDTFKYKPVTAEQVAQTMVDAAQSQNIPFEIYDNLNIQQHKSTI